MPRSATNVPPHPDELAPDADDEDDDNDMEDSQSRLATTDCGGILFAGNDADKAAEDDDPDDVDDDDDDAEDVNDESLPSNGAGSRVGSANTADTIAKT